MRKLIVSGVFVACLLGATAAPAGHSTGHLDQVRDAAIALRDELPPEQSKYAKRLTKLAALLSKSSSDLKGDLKVSKKAARYYVRNPVPLYDDSGHSRILGPFYDAQRGLWGELVDVEMSHRMRLSRLPEGKHAEKVAKKISNYSRYVYKPGRLTVLGVAVKQLKALQKLAGIGKALAKAETNAGATPCGTGRGVFTFDDGWEEMEASYVTAQLRVTPGTQSVTRVLVLAVDLDLEHSDPHSSYHHYVGLDVRSTTPIGPGRYEIGENGTTLIYTRPFVPPASKPDGWIQIDVVDPGSGRLRGNYEVGDAFGGSWSGSFDVDCVITCSDCEPFLLGGNTWAD